MTGYIMKYFWMFKNMDKLVLKLFLCSANEAICLAGATTIYTQNGRVFLVETQSLGLTPLKITVVLKRYKLKTVLLLSTSWTSS